MRILNYELLEKISEAPQSAVFKACHKKNPDRLLVLKILKAISLSDYKQAQVTQKIAHLKVLDDPLVITPIGFGVTEGICFITQSYFDGVTLSRLMEAKSPISLMDFFTLASKLTRVLEIVHEAGIIHGGVKPNNILVNFSTLDARLMDFISAVDVRDVSHFIYDRSFIRGTLAYTSPEQTGRINHRVGFSSDLYALGIIFYELLTGQLPFVSDDPLELIHSHLAEEALKIHEGHPHIPLVLSKIVAKLMHKQPEKRYQSATGLLADLVRCRDEFSAIGTIRNFPLEKTVCTQRVTFISKMVGRDREAELILREYERVARGGFRSLFISGLSGIGKTRLIQELGETTAICKAIVRYVYRTGEKISLQNAAQDSGFRDDPEAQRLQLRSVLCLPVVRQSKIVGAVYLENRLADAMFTPEKTQAIELVTSQAVISLENARLQARLVALGA